MYRPALDTRDRTGAIATTVAIHAVLLYAFLNLSGTIDGPDPQSALSVFDVLDPPSPAEEPPPPPAPREERTPEEEGAASPENIRSRATPVAAPKPRIELPIPLPVPTTETPNTGSDPTQGAADRPGPGTGAGGTGTGTGSGGSGSGTGGGGGGQASRPALVSPSLTARDYPRQLRRRWPSGGRVLVMFDVQLDGRATGCTVYQSSGNPQIDSETCRLVQTRLRFRPARNDRGVPYVTKYAYMQAPVNF